MKRKYNKNIEELRSRMELLENKIKYLEHKDMKPFIEIKTNIDCSSRIRKFILHYIDELHGSYETDEIYREELLMPFDNDVKLAYAEIIKEDKFKVYIVIKHYSRVVPQGISCKAENEYVIFNKSTQSGVKFSYEQIKEFNDFKEFENEAKNKQVSKTRKKPKVNTNR